MKSYGFINPFPINNITYSKKKKWGLKWKKSEYKILFNNLSVSLKKIISYNDSSPRLVVNEMHDFIVINEFDLQDFDTFQIIKQQVVELLNKIAGYSNLKDALLSIDENIYLNGLDDFYCRISLNITYAQEHIDLFRIIFNRISLLDECRFEYSIEIIVFILINFLKNEIWIAELIPEYIHLLERLKNYKPNDIDIIHIESLLIKLAFIIKKYFQNQSTEIIFDWLNYKDESKFTAINRLELDTL